MVLKGLNCVHNDKIGQMVLKGVIWVHNAKIRSHGLERSQLGTNDKIRLNGLEYVEHVHTIHNLDFLMGEDITFWPHYLNPIDSFQDHMT